MDLFTEYKNSLSGVSSTLIDKVGENIRGRSNNIFSELQMELYQLLQLRYLEWCDSFSGKGIFS